MKKKETCINCNKTLEVNDWKLCFDCVIEMNDNVTCSICTKSFKFHSTATPTAHEHGICLDCTEEYER